MNDRSVYPLGRRRTLVVLGGVLLGMLVAAMNQTVVSTALPTIVADLGGLAHYSWVFSAYMLGMTVTVPLYGKLSDTYGRRPLFVAAILVFSAGSVLAGLAPSLEILIAGRAVQGLGGGGLIPLALAVIGDLIPPRRRGRWQWVTGAVFAFSSLVGPVTGGWIADNASWRWAFFVSLPIAALALVVVWWSLGRRPGTGERRVDYLGALLLTAGCSAGLLAAVWGGETYPWASAPVLGLAVACVAALAAFGLWERRAVEPILPPSLLRNRAIATSTVALFFVGAAIFGAIMVVPLYLQAVLGVSATASAAAVTPLMLGWIASSAIAGQIVSRTGRYRAVLLAGPPIMAAGFFLLAGLDLGSSAAEATRAVVVVGAGTGLMMQTFLVVVQNAVPRGMLGVATASAQFSRTIGATVGVTAMGAIVSAHVHGSGAGGIRAAELAGAAGPVFGLGIALVSVAFVATLFLPHAELRDRIEDAVPESA